MGKIFSMRSIEKANAVSRVFGNEQRGEYEIVELSRDK